MFYLFGSALLSKYFDDYRQPNDIDYVTNNFDEYLLQKEKKKPGVEFYYIPMSPSRVMTSDELYTLKVSHAIYDIHWKKTMSDIRFMKMKGCKIDYEFFNQLCDYWCKVHTDKKYARFDFNNIPDGALFNDNVIRKFSHDDLHQMISKQPLYKKFVVNDIPSKDLFMKLPYHEQLSACFEETYVIALERYSNLGVYASFIEATRSLVTRMHPVWLAQWTIENWDMLYNASLGEKFNKFKTLINEVKNECTVAVV